VVNVLVVRCGIDGGGALDVAPFAAYCAVGMLVVFGAEVDHGSESV
jgi:hypothetical protein